MKHITRLSRLWLLLLLPTFFVVPLAHAQPTISCSSGCASSLTWGNGSFQYHGLSSYVTVSNPGIGSGEYFRRFIYVSDKGSNSAYLGMEKFGSSNLCYVCCGFGTGVLYYFYYLHASDGFVTSQCQVVPSGDINVDPNLFQINYDSAFGGSTDFFIADATGASMCEHRCTIEVNIFPLYYLTYAEEIQATWTGHKVWGSHWYSNQYINTADQHLYQGQPSACPGQNGCPSAHNPPQMYWYTYPGSSTTGGNLYSCDYDTGTTCQFGR